MITFVEEFCQDVESAWQKEKQRFHLSFENYFLFRYVYRVITQEVKATNSYNICLKIICLFVCLFRELSFNIAVSFIKVFLSVMPQLFRAPQNFEAADWWKEWTVKITPQLKG